MTTTKTELYDVLLKLRDDLSTSLHQMEDAASLDFEGAGYTNHQADDATAVFDQTADASALMAIRSRLRQVEEAVVRQRQRKLWNL
jgi:hypothetical protein